MLKYADMYVGW